MFQRFSFPKNFYLPISIVLSLVCGFALGRHSFALDTSTLSAASPFFTESAEQLLHIHATVDNSPAGFASFSGDALGNNYDNTIRYSFLRDVEIVLDGTPKKLEYAIRDGAITIEEIIAYARLDASNGFCYEIPRTKNGLTYWTYRYPYFDLWTVHDIYETPDGKQHLISEFGICATGRDKNLFFPNQDTGTPIDYEDWGITIEVSNVTPTSITLKFSQSGGQQIGDLIVNSYTLYRLNTAENTLEDITPLVDDFNGEKCPHATILKNGSTEITINFSPFYSELTADSYILTLLIEDQYTEEEVHPLTKNFYDEQYFDVAFVIN